MEIGPLPYSRLSIQKALLGVITPNLRAVTADIDEQNKKLCVIFFYDGELTDEIFDLASTAIAEIDLPDYELDDHINRLDYPNKIPIRGQLVYLRKE